MKTNLDFTHSCEKNVTVNTIMNCQTESHLNFEVLNEDAAKLSLHTFRYFQESPDD